MSNPRFVPRAYAQMPAQFGKHKVIDWVKPESQMQKERLVAAQIQHEFAFRIWRRLKFLRRPISEYAKALGVSYDRTAKVLRGATIMRLEDIAAAEIELGEIVSSR